MDKISQFISNDFPIYNQVNGPNLVAFISAYYEWMEQTGNIRDYANKIVDYRDVDNTLQQFVSHFQYEYLNQFPTNLKVDRQFLIKHVIDLYRAKGTKRGIALLFRILFDEDVSIYLPGNDVFQPSAAQYIQSKYIEVSDCPFLEDFVGHSIYSLNGGATALVESCDIVRTANKVINVLFLSNVVGTFLYGDRIMSNEVDTTKYNIKTGKFNFNYSYEGVEASGIIITIPTTTIGKYEVLGITGQRNGINIDSLSGIVNFSLPNTSIYIYTSDYENYINTVDRIGISYTIDGGIDYRIYFFSGVSTDSDYPGINNTFAEYNNISGYNTITNFKATEIVNNVQTSPYIVGSLSSVSIINGGIFYNVGDLVSIKGSGSTALGRISSTRSENGKVLFNLENGGFGYTLNAIVEVTGGYGSGATFSVGSLTNQQNYLINLDHINSTTATIDNNWLHSSQYCDDITMGYTLTYNNRVGGVFLVNETVNCQASNSVNMDFTYMSPTTLQPFEQLSNTTLGISVQSVFVDQPDFATIIGTDVNLNKLTAGQTLISNVTSSIISINSVTPKRTNFANGKITSSSGSTITITTIPAGINTSINGNNYPLPTATITGLTSLVTANLVSTSRATSWTGFSSYLSTINMDTPINLALTYETLTIGTIASLKNENPGNFYSANPTVTVIEPLIKDLEIDDGQGGVWGNNAIISGTTLYANGIATSIDVIDSGFGFSQGEMVELSIKKNSEIIQGVAITEGSGVLQGYWKTNPSGTSDVTRLFDSYYYQPYSYELISSRALESYQKLVDNLMGPLGFVMFGKYCVKDTQYINSEINYTNMISL